MPGVVAVLTADDLPLAGGSGRVAEPLARSEIVWSGQPVALVIAESEAAAEDGAARVWAEEEPLEAVLDLEAAMASGRGAVAGDRGRRRRRRRRGAHGAGGDADGAGAPDSPNVASFARLQRGRRGRRAGAGRRGRLRPLPHQLDPPGLPGAAVDAGLGRPGRHARRALLDPGRVHGAPGDRGAARAAAGPRARAGRAAGRRVRRQADDLRAAGGGRGVQAAAAGAARLPAQGGLRRRQPGAGAADRPRAGRHARRRVHRASAGGSSATAAGWGRWASSRSRPRSRPARTAGTRTT